MPHMEELLQSLHRELKKVQSEEVKNEAELLLNRLWKICGSVIDPKAVIPDDPIGANRPVQTYCPKCGKAITLS